MTASILVVGSVAFDSVKTPFGEANEILGGSATHFSVAASFFAPVRLVGVVGTDFGDAHLPSDERAVWDAAYFIGRCPEPLFCSDIGALASRIADET